LPTKPGPKAEATDPSLIASLVHPDHEAIVCGVDFSADGARLFTSGYPSGVIQFWDVASKTEVRRIDTPRGYRGSAEYALLTPDWTTLYVPVYKLSVKPLERDGKRLQRFDYSGATRVWDVPSGKEKGSLRPAAESAPVYAKLGPGGWFLACIELSSYDTSDNRSKDVTMVWDLAAGKKRKLCDGAAVPSFSPDGTTVVVSVNDYDAKTSIVKVLEIATGKELARVSYPEKGRYLSVGPVSPNGAVVLLYLGGKKRTPREVWCLDAKTLEERGKLIGTADPDYYGWGNMKFTPDAKRFIAFDGGKALVWDIAGRKLERTVAFGDSGPAAQLTISPDGKTLAVGWMPKPDRDLKAFPEPDPQDVPQPRVSLFDLAGNAPPRVLMAPHGFVGALAFSPDGKTLAFGSSGAVHLFDLRK
jgi:WD40 repeat protein